MDRRQQKTRAAIFAAFSELLAEKSYSKITVQEIIDAANVGRTTFYAHFETQGRSAQGPVRGAFRTHHQPAQRTAPTPMVWTAQGDAPESVFCHLLQHLQENDRNILGLLSCESSEIFLRYFKDSLSEPGTLAVLAQRCKRPDLPRGVSGQPRVGQLCGNGAVVDQRAHAADARRAGPVLPGSDGADPVRVRVSCADGCILTFPCYNKSNHRRKRAKGREKEGEPSFFRSSVMAQRCMTRLRKERVWGK